MELTPKLRDSKNLQHHDLYQLNVFPKELITKIASSFVFYIHVGQKDISGSDWGNTFAEAIGGKHLDSPIGIADVVLGTACWSMKTVKNVNPFKCKNIRLISGRCSPDYSYGITDPHKDIQKTGEAVLGIWNERVNIANDHFSQTRTTILIRSNDLLTYTLFEEDTQRYRTTDYYWVVNKNGNLEGKNEQGKTCFTWQPHGSQLTIHADVPRNALKFKIKEPPKLEKMNILNSLKFDETWVQFIE